MDNTIADRKEQERDKEDTEQHTENIEIRREQNEAKDKKAGDKNNADAGANEQGTDTIKNIFGTH